MALIVLDAGHGGEDFGAVYQGRREKDETLALALAVGTVLENRGQEVYYTRTTDIYEAPAQKALEGNQVGADYFVSIHRNSSPYPNQYSGVATLVYDRNGAAARMARNVNEELERVGFADQGLQERRDLAVLHQTVMPALLVEVGFLNTDRDNALLDQRFDETAGAIAEGILKSL